MTAPSSTAFDIAAQNGEPRNVSDRYAGLPPEKKNMLAPSSCAMQSSSKASARVLTANARDSGDVLGFL